MKQSTYNALQCEEDMPRKRYAGKGKRTKRDSTITRESNRKPRKNK